MIGAGLTSGRAVPAPPRHGTENGRDEPLLARVMGATGLMLWEVREPGLVLTSLQAGVCPSLDVSVRPMDPGPESRLSCGAAGFRASCARRIPPRPL